MRIYLIILLTSVLMACSSQTPSDSPTAYAAPADVDQRIQAVMNKYKAASAGVGIIRSGELVWTGYYGEEHPGKPINAQSMFNTASTNKAITAETALRLVEKGLIDLDEPISEYYIHPDLKDDPRHKLLTPRILLSHQAGFQNWPYLYEDGKLAFIDEPGNGNYNYAGIGFRIFAKFLEAKLDMPFPQIVRDEIFDPIGMTHATNSHDVAKTLTHIVIPVDETGTFETDYELETDYWSAADDLFISVEDYSKFLISTFGNESVSENITAERLRVQTDITEHEIWACGAERVDPCPSPYGHSIGWFVFGYERGPVLHHGGNDRSEGAITYYDPATGNGGIIFVNSPQGMLLWPEIADIVDPDQPITDVFQDLIRQYL